VDLVEVLLVVYLLQVLFVFLYLTINLPYKLPIVVPYLSTLSLVYKSVFGFNFLVQCFSLSLKLKDVLVRRKSILDILKYIFWSRQIASYTYICKGVGKLVNR
jgi:hypothetical protein